MKKSFAMAFAAAFAVSAFADITSGNVVGYNNQDVLAQQLVGTYFMSTTSESHNMLMSEIVPYVNGIMGGEDCAVVQVWNENTFTYVSYTWKGAKWMKGDVDGSNDEVPAGTAYWVTPGYAIEGLSLTVSGQLVDASNAERLAIPLVQARMQLVGNPYPTSVDVNDIKPVRVKTQDGSEVIDASDPEIGAYKLQYFNLGKGLYEDYYWTTEVWKNDGANGGDGTNTGKPGWCNNYEEAFGFFKETDNQRIFPVGSGFWVLPSEHTTKPYLAFPNPLHQ